MASTQEKVADIATEKKPDEVESSSDEDDHHDHDHDHDHEHGHGHDHPHKGGVLYLFYHSL